MESKKVIHKDNPRWGVGQVVFKGSKQNHPNQVMVKWDNIGGRCLWSYESNLKVVKIETI